jgi:hypothetical protein
MDVLNNSQRQSRSAKLPDVGRPRKRAIDEDSALSYRVSDALIRALDQEAEAMSKEQAPGHPRLSRGDVCRILLAEGLAAHAKTRAERSKPRQ